MLHSESTSVLGRGGLVCLEEANGFKYLCTNLYLEFPWLHCDGSKMKPGRVCKHQVILCNMEITCLSGGWSHVRSGAGRTLRRPRTVRAVDGMSAWCSLTCFQHVQIECMCVKTNGLTHHNGQVASKTFLQRNLRSEIETTQQEQVNEEETAETNLYLYMALIRHFEVEIIMSNHIS